MTKRKRPTPQVRLPRPPAARPAKTDRFVIGYIHPGETSAFFTHSLTGLVVTETVRGRLENVIQEWSSANVSAARNIVTARFLDEQKADWLLWVDADMAFDPDSYEALIDAADPVKAPVVGGLCFGASNDRLFPTIYQFAETEAGLTTMRVFDVPKNAMVQVGATGAAFLLIHRTVLQAIRDRAFNKAFTWFQEAELAGQPAGEDITFCIRAGICGFPIYVHTGVQVGHHKSHLLTRDLFDLQQAGVAP